MPIPENTASLFLCRTNLIKDPALLGRYRALLDAEELARLERYRLERDRHTFLISHALVRTALSEFADTSPAAWRFRRNRHGRPEIENQTSPPLRFSLSHTRDLVACAVSGTTEVGLDVEAIDDKTEILALAERYFAPLEVAALRALPSGKQRDRFIALWTLKEAYAKARGLGLSLPLHAAAFRIETELIEPNFNTQAAEEPSQWSFILMQPDPGRWLSLAARTGSASGFRLNAQWFHPLTNQNQTEECPMVAATNHFQGVAWSRQSGSNR
ncbi:MAG: 4'-phosphopantetheinyl transferase superfamily protein [Chthoniobacterales bacterium]|nr:4'-phosphopantetheinyl transferase superfamily protein [Chthoniobacterales bacterium]